LSNDVDEEGLDPHVDVVDDAAHGVDVFALGVFDRPVLVPLDRKIGQLSP
jgi:hypothetical protein